MNSRLFAIVMFSLFFGLTSTAQETKSEEETLFELSYNNYGPCVRLYKKDGKIMEKIIKYRRDSYIGHQLLWNEFNEKGQENEDGGRLGNQKQENKYVSLPCRS